MILKIKKTLVDCTLISLDGEINRCEAIVKGHYKSLTPRVKSKLKKELSNGEWSCVYIHSIYPVVEVYDMDDDLIEIYAKRVTEPPVYSPGSEE